MYLFVKYLLLSIFYYTLKLFEFFVVHFQIVKNFFTVFCNISVLFVVSF